MCEKTIPEERKSSELEYCRYIFIPCIRVIQSNIIFEDVAVYTLDGDRIETNIMNGSNESLNKQLINESRKIVIQAINDCISRDVLWS